MTSLGGQSIDLPVRYLHPLRHRHGGDQPDGGIFATNRHLLIAGTDNPDRASHRSVETPCSVPGLVQPWRCRDGLSIAANASHCSSSGGGHCSTVAIT
jgi:hypothetical protein